MVMRHGRYVIFQMAEVTVPKELFQEILRLINGLCDQDRPQRRNWDGRMRHRHGRSVFE